MIPNGQFVILWVILTGLKVIDSSFLHSTKIDESIKAKFFDGNCSGSSKVTDTVFEEERQAVSISVVLKRINDTFADRNSPKLQPALDLVVNQLVEPDIGIPLRRSQQINRHPLSELWLLT